MEMIIGEVRRSRGAVRMAQRRNTWRTWGKPVLRLLEWVWFDFLPIRGRPLFITVFHLQLAALRSARQGQSMKPVTTGPGISGAFSDDLVRLVSDLRVESKD